MGSVIINSDTTKNPITMIGRYAGECWGSDTSDDSKNYKRGIDCLRNQHGRTFEYPDVYMTIDGYSARVIREWYTHIGGSPTRLQASTRYINYNDFEYIIPPSINKNPAAKNEFIKAMTQIKASLMALEDMKIPKEDLAMLLPLGMTTKIVCKHNLRNLIDMSHQRMCNRAYWEYRELFEDVCVALSQYSDEWKYIVDNYFMSKCEILGGCPESKGCGKYPPFDKL